MSIDGPGILASDLAHDVYNQILDLYDAGTDVDEIRQRISEFEAALLDDVDLEIYLAACAKAFWEIGHLAPDLHHKLTMLIESGTSQALWAQTSDESLARERKLAVQRLLRQIAVPRKVARPRKKYAQIRSKLHAVGDCLELPAGERIYRGVVCKIHEYRGNCDYAILVMHADTRPDRESFESGSYYGRRIYNGATGGYILGPHVIRPEHRMLVRAGNPFKLVCHVHLDQDKYMCGSFGGVLDMSHVVADFERTQTRPGTFGLQLLPLHDLLGPGGSGLDA